MLSPALIRDQGVEVREPYQTRLLAAVGMSKPFHVEELPLEGVMRLIQQRTGHGHPRAVPPG